MAKGAIKKLVSPWSDYSIERNGVTIKLEAVELDRGDGKYLGLTATALKDLKLADIIKFTAKNAESGEGALGEELFKGKLVDLYNSAVFRNSWRQSVEELGNVEADKLSEDQKSKVLAGFVELVTRYYNEDTSREGKRDASYYRRKAAEKANDMKPIAKKAGGDISKLSPDELAKYRLLRKERDELIQIAEAKDKEEMAALESSLDDVLDAADLESTPMDTPLDTKPEEAKA